MSATKFAELQDAVGLAKARLHQLERRAERFLSSFRLGFATYLGGRPEAIEFTAEIKENQPFEFGRGGATFVVKDGWVATSLVVAVDQVVFVVPFRLSLPPEHPVRAKIGKEGTEMHADCDNPTAEMYEWIHSAILSFVHMHEPTGSRYVL